MSSAATTNALSTTVEGALTSEDLLDWQERLVPSKYRGSREKESTKLSKEQRARRVVIRKLLEVSVNLDEVISEEYDSKEISLTNNEIDGHDRYTKELLDRINEAKENEIGSIALWLNCVAHETLAEIQTKTARSGLSGPQRGKMMLPVAARSCRSRLGRYGGSAANYPLKEGQLDRTLGVVRQIQQLQEAAEEDDISVKSGGHPVFEDGEATAWGPDTSQDAIDDDYNDNNNNDDDDDDTLDDSQCVPLWSPFTWFRSVFSRGTEADPEAAFELSELSPGQ